MTNATTPTTDDRVIYRGALQAELDVTSKTIARWMKTGKLPEPDVKLSLKTMGWRLSTLRAAGINLV